MSVPVVPSKSADQSAADADNALTWPPPEDPRFALDVMDLETRRVMSARDAATELEVAPADDDPAQFSRSEASRPIAFPPPAMARRTARTAPSDGVDDIAPRADAPVHAPPRFNLPLMRAAVAIIVVQATVIAVFLLRGRSTREGAPPAKPAATVEARTPAAPALPVDTARVAEAVLSPPVHAVATTGRLLVRTDPPGAPVVVDGQRRGATPVSVGELAAGGHRVQLGAAGTAIEQTVTIEAGATTTLVVPMASVPPAASAGWLNVASTIDVQLLENGRALGTSAEGPLRLAPGTHRLQLVNDALGYRGQETVAIRAGEMVRLRPSLPDGLLHVNAQPWASVWIDGQRVGDTPLANIKVSLGRHEVRFRHPSLGEQVRQVVVSAAEPARVSVNMKP